MSIQFNDTTNYKGLMQFYELECGFAVGTISGSDTEKRKFAAAVNVALDDFFALAFYDDGNSTWNFDDLNHVSYPIVTTDLVSGQREYPFVADSAGNYLNDIYRVFARISSTGVFKEIFPVNVQSDKNITSFVDGLNAGGIPSRYDKTSNALFLDLVPNYNSSGGLLMYVNREGSYFTYDDTTKKPGVPSIYHKYFYLKPAMEYQRRNNYTEFLRLQGEVLMLENKIGGAFSKRARDERPRMRTNQEDCH